MVLMKNATADKIAKQYLKENNKNSNSKFSEKVKMIAIS